jgi:hypothetical protein
VFSGHKTLLACFALIVGSVGVAWWLWVFGCMIFVSLLWNIIIKGMHASTDAEAGAWLPFRKKSHLDDRRIKQINLFNKC